MNVIFFLFYLFDRLQEIISQRRKVVLSDSLIH